MMWMKMAALSVCAAAWVLGGGTQQEVHVIKKADRQTAVFVTSDDSDTEMMVNIDGLKDKFDLSSMEEGDVNTYTLSNGETIEISKVNGAFQLVHNGETIEIHNDHGLSKNMFVMGGFNHGSAIRISGLSDLDQAQKDAIIDAIRAQGIDKEVVFEQSGSFVWIEDDSGDATGVNVIKVH
ncbi:MAG: hypothetical protein KDC35_02510 [Acidobacteria bacterium]|nr:hypothetical protein [Acidobacteriota bacterium]